MRRVHFLLAVACTAVALAASVPAQACGAAPTVSLMHDALPEPLPEHLLVISVVIPEPDLGKLYGDGLEAMVIGTIQGRVSGNRVLIRQTSATSCDNPFYNGTTGLVIGIVQGEEGGMMVITPILMPKGWVLQQTDTGLTQARIGDPGVAGRRDRVDITEAPALPSLSQSVR